MSRSPSNAVSAALAAIAAGAATGAACMTAGVLALRWIPPGDPPDPASAAVVTLGLAAGILAAALSGWHHTRSVPEAWQRGVAAALAVLAATVLAAGAIPVDYFGGRVTLSGYALLVAAGAVLGHARARRERRRA